MATVKLSDDREFQQMTPEQADALFASLAVLDAGIRRAAAETDKKIADLKKSFEERTADDSEQCKILAERLKAYIAAHRGRFVRPRQRKTPFGQYGLRTVTDTKIIDEQFVMAFSDERRLGLYTVTRKIDKNAVGRAIEQYGEVPGAKIVSGDVASYTVSKSVLDQQTKQ